MRYAKTNPQNTNTAMGPGSPRLVTRGSHSGGAHSSGPVGYPPMTASPKPRRGSVALRTVCHSMRTIQQPLQPVRRPSSDKCGLILCSLHSSREAYSSRSWFATRCSCPNADGATVDKVSSIEGISHQAQVPFSLAQKRVPRVKRAWRYGPAQ